MLRRRRFQGLRFRQPANERRSAYGLPSSKLLLAHISANGWLSVVFITSFTIWN